MRDGISISPEESAVRVAIREFVNSTHLFLGGGTANRRQKHMNESEEQQMAGEASSNPQNSTTPKTWKKRWNFKSLVVVMSLIVLIAGTFLLRSVLFPNYLGVGIALCVVAFGLFLVRGAIRMLLEFDKLEEQALKENEATTSPSEANVVCRETDCSAHPPEI